MNIYSNMRMYGCAKKYEVEAQKMFE